MDILSFLQNNWIIISAVLGFVIWNTRLEGKVGYQGDAIKHLGRGEDNRDKDMAEIKTTLATLVERTSWLSKYGDKFFKEI